MDWLIDVFKMQWLIDFGIWYRDQWIASWEWLFNIFRFISSHLPDMMFIIIPIIVSFLTSFIRHTKEKLDDICKKDEEVYGSFSNEAFLDLVHTVREKTDKLEKDVESLNQKKEPENELVKISDTESGEIFYNQSTHQMFIKSVSKDSPSKVDIKEVSIYNFEPDSVTLLKWCQDGTLEKLYNRAGTIPDCFPGSPRDYLEMEEYYNKKYPKNDYFGYGTPGAKIAFKMP